MDVTLKLKDCIDNDKFEEAINVIDFCRESGSYVGLAISKHFHDMHLIQY